MEKLILFQGDSITDSSRHREFDDGRGQGYATMVSGELGANYPYQYQFLNRGISGNRSVDLLARIKEDIINLKPDYLSILIGVNDVWHELDRQNGVSAEKYEVILDMIIDEVKTALPNIKIMLLEPFVLPGSGTRENPAIPGRNFELFDKEVRLRAAAAKRIADKYSLTFVPLQDVFTKAQADAPCEDYWLKDGVHPTAFGHTLIKREWIKAFETIR